MGRRGLGRATPGTEQRQVVAYLVGAQDGVQIRYSFGKPTLVVGRTARDCGLAKRRC